MSEQDSTLQSTPRRVWRSWTDEELQILREQYPQIGLRATAFLLGCKQDRVRSKASSLGIKQDRSSRFFKQWQRKAARGKVGKKRPDHSAAMKAAYANGDLPHLEKLSEYRRKLLHDGAREHRKRFGHPRGASGMKHTAQARAEISKRSKDAWNKRTPIQRMDMVKKMMVSRVRNGTVAPNKKRGSWKASWRVIGGIRKFYRSRWEANYARFLEWRKQRGEVAVWLHEPETFWFDGVKRGCVSYLPDFKVTLPNGDIEFHEVKGWMDPASKTKIKRMKKYHPSVVLIVIDSKSYQKLERLMQKTVPEWE